MQNYHQQTGAAQPAPRLVSEARFRGRVVRMGVVSPAASTAATMEALVQHRMCTHAAQQWLGASPDAVGQRDQWLAEVYEHLVECPSPETEWQAVREVLQDDALLARLLGVVPVSVRRYAKGERQCSDAVAARLHWLALVIDQLEGTYNAYGMRRWFQRPRAALGNQAPQDRLSGEWDPDDLCIREINVLAESASKGMVAS
jgi:hypothetical protein